MDNRYNTTNYMKPGGEELVIGGKLTIESGLMPNQAAISGSTAGDVKTAVNNLLIKLKNAGLMAGDAMTIAVTAATANSDPNADRGYNTDKIKSVAYNDGVITITLKDNVKVKDLKDFDGGSGWGTHKWLGIGVSGGITPITGMTYNGTALTAEDVSEATNQAGLSAGYFVRWVAADLVLKHDNSQRSKDHFTLRADGYAKHEITLEVKEG